MSKTYPQGTLKKLLSIEQDGAAIGHYALRPDGLWFLPPPGFAGAPLAEQEAVSGFSELEHIDTPDGRLYGLSTTEGAKPLLPFPFTARQLWEFNDAAGEELSGRISMGDDTEAWIAKQAQGVQELARVLLADEPPSDAVSEAAFVGGFYSAGGFDLRPWVNMKNVAPLEAARFLSGQNPIGNQHHDGGSVQLLARVFEDAATSNPASRTLLDWVQVAQERGSNINAGMANFVTVHTSGKDTTAPVEDSASNVPVKARRDLLTPVIEAAQKDCENPFDTSAVWASLVRMAGAGKPPLMGVSDEGIKWQDSNDETQFLNIKSLRDRLRRSKKKAR